MLLQRQEVQTLPREELEARLVNAQDRLCLEEVRNSQLSHRCHQLVKDLEKAQARHPWL